MKTQKIIYLGLRFSMALIFLWAFFDKTFGLGFATKSANAWVSGGSPTYGFLTFGTHGPFVEFFKSIAGLPVVDWMFMLGLLFVGVTLLLNRYVLWGAIAGSMMLILMWLAMLPPENHPFLDDHLVYVLIMALLVIKSKSGELNWKS
jgi:thiosulfate dehydrogenase [quinone] large subunit